MAHILDLPANDNYPNTISGNEVVVEPAHLGNGNYVRIYMTQSMNSDSMKCWNVGTLKEMECEER